MIAKEVIIDEVIPYELNPRNNHAAVDKVAASIKEFGFQQPIIVNENMVIICGHTRLEASKMLGLRKVPCLVVKGLTEAQEKAYRLADNKVAELSEWDFEKLRRELEDLEDMEQFGFEELKNAIKHDAEEQTKKQVICPRCGEVCE